MIAVAALAVLAVAGVLGLTLHDACFRPTFRRLATRNLVRRKHEALLVVLGSLLGTAIITSSFVVGDTLDASVRDLARTQYGPIDELVAVNGVDQLDRLEDLVSSPPVPGTDGTLRIVSSPATAATAASTASTVSTPSGDPGEPAERRAEPDAMVHEVDFGAARAFGSDPSITGFDHAGRTPGPGEAAIGDDLASTLHVGPGDHIDVFVYGDDLSLEVVATLPRLGVAGFYPRRGGTSPVVFVAPGTLADLAAASAAAGAAPPQGYVAVSNEGHVFDSAAVSDGVKDTLTARIAGVDGAQVYTAKQDLLDEAKAAGESFGLLFSAVGSFSVLAGILLLINIFVMLSEERKTELGMLRAVGFKRNHLIRAFGMEGSLYSLVAAVAGALAGIGVGRVIVLITAGLFRSTGDTLQLRFGVEPSSIAVGFLTGLVIALVTVWGTSLRIARLNVIRAIRDLPDPPRTGARPLTLAASSVGVAAFGALGAAGIAGRQEIAALLGVALAIFCTVPLLSRLLPRRWAVSLPCALVLVWGIFSFALLPDVFESSNIFAFVVQGIVLVVAAVAVAIINDDQFNHITDRLSGSRRGLATRLGLANPLAKRFRTGLLLGMYSIVLFMLTFMATFSGIFSAQAPRLTDDVRAGYDLLVDSNPANPLTAELLRDQPGVAGVATLQRGFPKFYAPALDPEPQFWPMSGFDEALLTRQAPALASRDRRYPSDADAWRAVLASPDLAVVPDYFLQDNNGPPQSRLAVGDTFEVINPATLQRWTLTVAGVVDSDFTGNGVMVGAPQAARFADVAVPSRHYVALRPGVDPDAAAAALTGRLLANGADAESFRRVIEDELSQQEGFIRLMQGFLALGLVIGTAGLGVVMVRAVRERRRQIGMLRAIGFPSLTVRSAFLVEASFIALQGIVIGVGLGLVTSWSLLSSSATFGDQPLPFTVPWLALMLLPAVSLGASLIAVYAPAAQAARIKPAVALRMAD